MAKRIRVTQVIVPVQHTEKHVIEKACRIAGIRPEHVRRAEIVRQSLDARKNREITYHYTVDLIADLSANYSAKDARVRPVHPVRYAVRPTGREEIRHRIVVVGAGPAGLFAALSLAEQGYRPLVVERGRSVEQRCDDVRRFWETGRLDPSSNVQFGEGGAGAFSDGKLATGVNDKQGRNRFVLETFVRFGAPHDILYAAQPHIGTDCLCRVVAAMREEIRARGGSFRYATCVTDLAERDGRLFALVTGDGERIPTDAAVFAIGHSARDTFSMLRRHGVAMEAKPFAVGLRVEHPQDFINAVQYGECPDRELLPPASYKLTYRAANGRSVYSFCMCPGGFVVNASSEEGGTVVNGMSDRARDGANANSAVIVSVTPEDYPDPDDPLSGVAFQLDLERKAYAAGQGKIPQQRFGDFAEEKANGDGSGHSSNRSPDREGITSAAKGGAVFTDIRDVLPDPVRAAFLEGMHAFSERMPGFDRPDAILSAVESRTSSPVRILRGENMESSLSGLYPCGEGAGYAGGITSSAIDGLKAAEAVMQRFAAPDTGERKSPEEIF